MPKKDDVQVPRNLALEVSSFIVLAGVGSIIAHYVPHLSSNTANVFKHSTSITFHQIVALVLLSAITVIFLSYYRARNYFSTRWLIAAAAYNVLMLFVKFTLSTHELPKSLTHSFRSTVLAAFLISLLYIAAFGLLYLFFDGRLLHKKLHKALITSTEGKALLAMGLFVCATILRIVVFRLPYLSHSNASNYLRDIFKTEAVLLSVLLFVMILCAVEAYAQVRRRVDLRSFFITGVGLILTFHLWWAIFIVGGH
jgi:general stress protein CsbA